MFLTIIKNNAIITTKEDYIMATKKYKANEDFNIDWSVFRSNLGKLIDSKGMTKADLSRNLNLAISTITRYFYESTPDIYALWMIADYFDVQIDWLLGRSKERWETLPPDLQMVCDKYNVATENDKLVIRTILEKYADK